MRRLRYCLVVVGVLFCLAGTASAEVSVSVGIGLPNLRIGINLSDYPQLAPIPGYPVYYAPRLDANYFFYDGLYWVYWDDNWYASSWYNGPWALVSPYVVPVYILRVPVAYYQRPPVYFRDWYRHGPPRWDRHWGRAWEQRRSGWDRWNRSAVPRRAPLPEYQQRYTRDRYPSYREQQRLRNERYRYEPSNRVVRQHLRQASQWSPGPYRRDGAGRPALDRQREERRRQGGVQAPVQRAPRLEERSRPPVQREQRGPREYQQRGPERKSQERGVERRSMERGAERRSMERGGGRGPERGRGSDGGGSSRGRGQGREEGRGR